MSALISAFYGRARWGSEAVIEDSKVDATASEITPIIASNLQDWGLILW